MPSLARYLVFIASKLSGFDQQPEFVVEVPYTTAPKMNRYTGPLTQLPPNPFYIEAKQSELALLGDELCAEESNPQTQELINTASQKLGIASQTPVQTIRDLALHLNEDVALLQNDILTAICFCFPSSWVPAKRLGMPLAQIHRPVADGEKLVNASPKIAHVMSDLEQGSFRRYVWTISNSPRLSQHPKHKTTSIPRSIDELYYRLETQTTLPLASPHGRASLFLVKVEVCPLNLYWRNPQYREQIMASVDSMSPAVLEYKNLQHIRNVLLSNQ
jgi:hypothetical protein